MKLGAIKAAVVSLMYPDEILMLDETDDESFNSSLYELSCNPNLQGVLDACASSVNRCLAYLEGRSIGEFGCVHFQGSACSKDAGGRTVITLPSDASLVHSVILRRGAQVIYPSYTIARGCVLADTHTGIYTVVYLQKQKKITAITDNCHEVYLPCGLDEQIPYYVAADLTAQENPTFSKWARDTFEDAVSQAERSLAPPCQSCVLSVYGDD